MGIQIGSVQSGSVCARTTKASGPWLANAGLMSWVGKTGLSHITPQLPPYSENCHIQHYLHSHQHAGAHVWVAHAWHISQQARHSSRRPAREAGRCKYAKTKILCVGFPSTPQQLVWLCSPAVKLASCFDLSGEMLTCGLQHGHKVLLLWAGHTSVLGWFAQFRQGTDNTFETHCGKDYHVCSTSLSCIEILGH